MTEQEFAAYWKVLCERHGKTGERRPSTPITRVYALTLESEGITAEQWGRAVALSIRHDDFFPSAQRLVDYARGGRDFEALALAEWDAALTRARAGEMATLPQTLTRRLMNSATNGTPLGDVPSDQLPWIKREFLRRYADALKEEANNKTPALLSSSKKELPNAS